jgi:hypothetical protein
MFEGEGFVSMLQSALNEKISISAAVAHDFADISSQRDIGELRKINRRR